MAYTDYASLFGPAEQKYGLPPGTLSGVGYVESRYNPKAVSPAGAQGMMQFMPATAKGVGLSNPFDPAASVDAAGNLLSQNMKATGGNLRDALMMYNAGTNPAKWNPSYADSVLAHGHSGATGNTDPAQGPYYNPPSGGSQPMPPQKPMSLGAMMGQQAPVNLSDPAPVNTDAMGTSSLVPQGNSLGAMAQGLPGMPAKAPSKFTAGNIMGVLGDALSAYGGKAPTFAPFMREQQLKQQDQSFEREKFQQELAMRMYTMMHPEDVIKADLFNASPPAEQRAQLKYQDAMHPEYTMTPVGQVLNHRVTQPPSAAIAELRQAVTSGDHGALAEFDRTFGPGASAEALGGQ